MRGAHYTAATVMQDVVLMAARLFVAQQALGSNPAILTNPNRRQTNDYERNLQVWALVEGP